jgi:hypothetical protein
MQAADFKPDEEALVAELELLGIRYLSRQTSFLAAGPRPPAQLLADLVRQPSARVRESVISLLLTHPYYAAAVPDALAVLRERERLTLRLFYTAAVLLQAEYVDRLEAATALEVQWLPDLFSVELGVPPPSVPYRSRMSSLAETHQRSTGIAANWAGTYENVAVKLLRRWEKERHWSQSK